MAIDTKSLTQIITEFRALQSKDAVSPESLGYILQRIVDLLSTAGTSETINSIQKLLDGFKAAGQAITALSQGQSDRNHIYANKSTVNLATGAVSSSAGIFIQQATTERAGAMRAQQVIDLNATKKAVAEVEKILEIVQVKLGMTEGSKTLFNTAQIAVLVVNGVLKIHGAQQLIADGYVPYLFRLTRKRNQWGRQVRPKCHSQEILRSAQGVEPVRLLLFHRHRLGQYNLFLDQSTLTSKSESPRIFSGSHHARYEPHTRRRHTVLRVGVARR